MSFADEYDAQFAPQQQIATPKPQGGGGLLGFIKGTVGSIVNPIVNTGSNIFKLAQTNALQGVQSKVNEKARLDTKKIADEAAAGKISYDEAAKKSNAIMQGIKGVNTKANTAQATSNAINPTEAAANAADAALTLGSLGTAGIAKAAGKGILENGLKGAVKRGIGQGSVYGGAYGALQPLEQGETNPSNVANSALNSAITGGLLGGAVGLGSKAASKLTSGKLAQKAENAGGRILASQSRGALDKRLAREAPDVYKTMNNFGIRNVNDFQDVASKVTGNEGAVNLGKMNIIANSPNTVNAPNWQSKAVALLDEQTGITPRDAKTIRGILDKTDNNIQNSLSKRLGTSRAANIGEAHPEDLYTAAQDLQSKAYDALGNKTLASATDAQKAKFNVLNSAAKYLKSTVDEAVSKNGIPDTVKQDIIADLNSRGINNKKLIAQVQNAKSIGDLNKIESPFVKASQIGQQTAEAGNIRSQGLPTDLSRSTVAGLAANAVAPAANRTAGRALLGISKENPISSSVNGIANAVGGRGILGNLTSQVVGRTSVGQPDQQPAESNISPSLASNPAMDTSSDTSSNDYLFKQNEDNGVFSDPRTIQALLLSDIQDTGGKNVSTLLSLYNAFKPAASSQATANQQKMIASAESGQNALDQIQALYNSTGGASGPIGGTISNILGNTGLNSDVSTYNQVSKALVAQIAKALGNSGTLSDKDIQIVSGYIPQLTDTPQTAQAKIQSLQGLLDNAKQNARRGFGTDSTDISSNNLGL